jgi:hypothetical protein
MSDMESLVKAYLTIRSERERIETEYEEKDRKLREDMVVLEREMLAGCNASGMQSVRTTQGTIIKSLKERFTCADRDNFNKFVLETGAVELFAAHLHQSNFKEFMAERHHEGLPPGVNVTREFTITVRKPTVKNDFN